MKRRVAAEQKGKQTKIQDKKGVETGRKREVATKHSNLEEIFPVTKIRCRDFGFVTLKI